jgi:hypothetical protein
MKKFIYLLTRTFLIVFTACLLFEAIIIFNSDKNPKMFGSWNRMNAIYADVVFLGASRTWVQYDLKMLSKLSKQKYYAISEDGYNSKIHFAKLKYYLSRNASHLPQKCFISFDHKFINQRTDFFNKRFFLKDMYLAPFRDLNYLNYFDDLYGFEYSDYYFPLARYLGFGNDFFDDLFSKNQLLDEELLKYGTKIQKAKWQNDKSWTLSLNDNREEKLNFNWCDSIVNLLSRNNIECILVKAPFTHNFNVHIAKQYDDELKKYAAKNNLLFVDFNSKKYDNKKLFYNHTHLNSHGVDVFMRQFRDTFQNVFSSSQ